MPFYSVLDRHNFFYHFSPFQKIVLTIIFPIDFQNRGISDEKDSFEWVPPAKLQNVIFEAPNAQKTKNCRLALKPAKLPEVPL